MTSASHLPKQLGVILSSILGFLICNLFLETPLYGQESSKANPSANAKPNFVVIFVDDMGYGDLGCFGHPTIATPNLDQLAEQGQRWTQFYVAACVCTPSRAALQTGRYPIRNGMCSNSHRVLFPDSKGGLPPEETTIASLLKTAGYQTHAIGKWHLGHLPQHLPTSHGYDTYYGIPYSNDMDATADAPKGRQRFNQPESRFFNVPLMDGENIVERPADQTTITRRYTEQAVQRIEQSDGTPFLIYLAHNLPHVPLFRSPDFEGVSRRGLYGDVVEEIDWSVGQVVAALKKKGIAENTLVVFTSDNGPWKVFNQQGGSAGLLRDGKGSTWEGGMREPTIFWWPGKIQPAVQPELGSTLDLLPTIANLAGVALPETTLDGFDLSATLIQQQPSPREAMFYYHGEEVFAVRKGRYKAHFKTKTSYVGQKEAILHDPPLLFDLEVDPSEAYNLAAQHPEIIEEITQLKQSHEGSIQPVVNQLERR